MIKRSLLPVFLLGVLTAAPSASAKVIELGQASSPTPASCPADPCSVLARTTGYMGRMGNVRDPFVVRRAGRIVAFTVKLGRPDSRQLDFFNGTYGSPARVRLSILRRGRTRRTRLSHRLLRQSELIRVDRYFGSAPSFVLDRPLRVSRGNIVALTTPTWAPAFSEGVGRNFWWRSSRRKNRCRPPHLTQRAAQQSVGGRRNYGCRYLNARILYTATYVTDPRPTDGSDRRGR